MAQWQARWEENDRKRVEDQMPNPQCRLDFKYWMLEYYMMQILTGHGVFKTYLRRIGKVDSNIVSYEVL